MKLKVGPKLHICVCGKRVRGNAISLHKKKCAKYLKSTPNPELMKALDVLLKM